ncbi:hypothetical protein E9840_11350 [Tissierella creatinini]|nr:hypothetical protein E9840_11350 [Tissierella creatinini]TJX60877.1 hypothetical protein E8P77_19425 [Soehngenia saccharolytica]
MSKKPKISHLHLRGLLVSNMIGVGILSLPNSLADVVGNNGWLVLLIAGFLFIGLFLIYNQIFNLYPGKDIFEISRETLGFFYYPGLVIMFLYFTLFAAIIARNLGELIKIFLLQTTPISIIILVFIMATAYLTSHEIDCIARAGYFIYPIIIIFTIMIVLISLPKADYTHLLPVLKTDLKSVVKGVGTSSFSYFGVEIAFFAIPYVEDREKIVKSGVLGIITVTLIYIVLVIMTLAHFSLEQIKSIVYPILLLVRQLDLPGFFLENLDGMILSLWVLVVFATIAPNYYAAAIIMSKVLKTKHHKYFVLGLVPVLLIISLLPENFIVLFDIVQKYHNILAVLTLLVIPVAILISAYFRKKVQK